MWDIDSSEAINDEKLVVRSDTLCFANVFTRHLDYVDLDIIDFVPNIRYVQLRMPGGRYSTRLMTPALCTYDHTHADGPHTYIIIFSATVFSDTF